MSPYKWYLPVCIFISHSNFPLITLFFSPWCQGLLGGLKSGQLTQILLPLSPLSLSLSLSPSYPGFSKQSLPQSTPGSLHWLPAPTSGHVFEAHGFYFGGRVPNTLNQWYQTKTRSPLLRQEKSQCVTVIIIQGNT